MKSFFSIIAILTAVTIVGVPSAGHAQETGLTDHEQNLVDAYRVMEGVTLGLLGAQLTLGAPLLYNLPTSFGDGACARGEGAFGAYGCPEGERGLSILHGALGIGALGSYIATGVLAIAAPDLDQGQEDTVTDVLGVAHGVGIGLTGLLGLLSAFPQIIGIVDQQDQREFARHLRVVHAVVALLTAGAFASHAVIDYVD